ncbi:hypothetical protein IGI04_001668 [Brassica rapa subsp. trilocularis]|uniref:Uncharacterized protein n=1 Tax=Brassica rapa subsp. trilocularis TaxID=1813537 RepID=A0ABQ7NU62_BRACM|nr:hypothetical protein IGI04_001668 [Brassica rapa subsp. trilocularis]
MVKSKSKKKGNLNKLQCGEGNVTASMSKLRCGEDDMTASRSELRCGETRRRTGHASIVEKKTTSSRGVKQEFMDNAARYFNYMTTSRVYDVVHNNNVLNINLVSTH